MKCHVFHGISSGVINEGKHLDNNPSAEAITARRPGRPKGLPKPTGSGRQKGTPNKIGKEARDLADRYTPKAFRRLGELLDNPDPKVVAIAAQQILDRRYGRPVNPQEVTGKDGTPLGEFRRESDLDVARRLAFILERGRRVLDETVASGGENVVPMPKGNRNAS